MCYTHIARDRGHPINQSPAGFPCTAYPEPTPEVGLCLPMLIPKRNALPYSGRKSLDAIMERIVSTAAGCGQGTHDVAANCAMVASQCLVIL